MRKIRTGVVLFVVAATASAAPAPTIVQISNGAAYGPNDGPQNRKFVAAAWNEDQTPDAPGNADGSIETFLIDVRTNALRQITSLPAGGKAHPIAWLADGRLLLRANGDVTTGAATSLGGIRLYLHKPGAGSRPGTTTLVSETLDFGADVPRVLLSPNGRTWFFETTADLGGNADGSQEVYAYDPKKGTLRQLTNGPDRDSQFMGVVEKGKRLLLWSTADLTGQGTNVSGESAAFLFDLKTSAFEQITSGDERVLFSPDSELSTPVIDPTGRWISLTFVIEPPMSVHYDRKIYDLKTRTFRPSIRDGALRFVPGSSLALLSTQQDLVPSATPGEGNADGSYEVFTMDLKTGQIVQRTASAGDSRIGVAPTNRNVPVVVHSTGDLTPGAPGNVGGLQQIFFVSIAAKPKPTVQATAGASGSTAEFVVGGHVVFFSSADLVPGGNADGSSEVFAANTKGPLKLRQITSAPSGESYTWNYSQPLDGRTVFLLSTGDITPGAPGNADGSEELYRARIR
jgi:Tol biopolymer transport system component